MNDSTMLYAPMPVEMCFTLKLDDFSRRDARFADPALLAAGPAALVQDSAALLNAHLTLSTARGVFHGRPVGHGATTVRRREDWHRHLGLSEVHARTVAGDAIREACQATTGVVYTFCHAAAQHAPERGDMVIRQYALGDWCDRLELEFLLNAGCPGVDVIRGHRLTASGQLDAWTGQPRAVLR